MYEFVAVEFATHDLTPSQRCYLGVLFTFYRWRLLTAQLAHASSAVERRYIQIPWTRKPYKDVTSYTGGWSVSHCRSSFIKGGSHLDLAELALVARPLGDSGFISRADGASGSGARRSSLGGGFHDVLHLGAISIGLSAEQKVRCALNERSNKV